MRIFALFRYLRIVRRLGLVRQVGGFVRSARRRRRLVELDKEEHQAIGEMGRRAWELRGSLPSMAEEPSRFDEIDAQIAERNKQLQTTEDRFYFREEEQSPHLKELRKDILRLKDEIADLTLAKEKEFYAFGQQVDADRFHDVILDKYYKGLDAIRQERQEARETLRALRRDRLKALPFTLAELVVLGMIAVGLVRWRRALAHRRHPIFKDTFETAVSDRDWHTFKNDETEIVVKEGKLHLIAKRGMKPPRQTFRTYTKLPQKFRFGAKLRRLKGDEGFGLLFCRKSSKRFFVFEIRQDHEFRLARRTPAETRWKYLTDWEESEHILPADQLNELVVLSEPGKIQLFANGHLLKTVDVSPGLQLHGKIGIFMRGLGAHVTADDVFAEAPRSGE